MVGTIAKLSCAVLLAVSTVPAKAVEVITNGDFQSGLTGWTGYVTTNGTISQIPGYAGGTRDLPAIKSFNVSGSGPSNALALNAGANPSSSTLEGGGVTQTFTTTGGTATFFANIADHWLSASGSIASIGVFSVLLDGQLMDSHDFGIVTANPQGWTLRDTLSFTTTLSAGEHTLSLQVTRRFAPGVGVDAEYFDNVSLNVEAVPEPSTWAMLILGFAGVGYMAYRRRNGTLAA
ncbi:hypothetical protein ACH79_43670 [Bradyrhizobium sp. CCBAU 051011]|uniref:PEPxxWA-CTERM sorting domain-containing protein n=1 Tax=Bradyrhizobium sp. CCBAU 051011 TaxID=858422 RepID=UPI001373BA28|nr:PEPxxWA-CTERM sorting domain-containing protein [Bradyrhizobium sp. CCBAU 051011]QHO78473.1 hypothetical protein ACH79_43670 [Bradyrhizobium sp. CCBAU 051011]